MKGMSVRLKHLSVPDIRALRGFCDAVESDPSLLYAYLSSCVEAEGYSCATVCYQPSTRQLIVSSFPELEEETYVPVYESCSAVGGVNDADKFLNLLQKKRLIPPPLDTLTVENCSDYGVSPDLAGACWRVWRSFNNRNIPLAVDPSAVLQILRDILVDDLFPLPEPDDLLPVWL